MKRLIGIIVVLTVLSGLWAGAQELPAAFLKAASDSRLKISFNFSAKMDKQSVKGSGTVLYQGGAYRMECDGFRLYDDLVDKWSINEISKEAVAENSSEKDVLKDPGEALAAIGIDAKGGSFKTLTDASGMLTGIEMSAKGMSLSIKIPSVKVLPKGPLGDFSFDPDSLDSSYVITDLR